MEKLNLIELNIKKSQMDNKNNMIREIDNKRIFGVIEIDIIKLEKEFNRLKNLT